MQTNSDNTSKPSDMAGVGVEPGAGLGLPVRAARVPALLALVLLVPIPTAGVVLGMGMGDFGVVGQCLFFVAKGWLLALPVVWVLMVDRGSLRWPRFSSAGIATGTVLGVAIAGVMLGVFAMWGEQLVDAEAVRAMAADTGLDTPWKFIAFFIYLCFVNSLLEEYVWRWFVFLKCEVLVRRGWIAVVLSGLLFAVHHIVALRLQMGWVPTVLGSAGVFVGGVAWSWCYLKYRSIWPGYISHVIADLAVGIMAWQLIFG